MTARVHAHMQLGVLPSGDFSFEAPDAVVELDTRDEHLCITVVSPQFELEIGDGQRTRDLIVSPQTHVRLEFLGHLLDIDNDFAVSSPTGNALEIHVVREGEPRVLPESATVPPRSSAEIIVAEQFAGGRSAGVDSLQREHAAARADKKLVVERRPDFRRIAGALAGSILIVSTLAVVALNVAERSKVPAVMPITESEPEPLNPAGLEVIPGAGPDVLARFTALVEMEPLPDKATLDFAVESLKSLRIAYPEDPGVPAALTQLSQRLVVEARVAYDRGDAFLAGRLIEQAATIGLATTSVDETLAYFAAQPPGTAVLAQPDEDSTRVAASTPEEVPETGQEPQAEIVEPAAELTEAELTEVEPAEVEPTEAQLAESQLAEEMLAEAISRELAASEADPGPALAPDLTAQSSESDQLDQLVESATGVALGALAVELVITDTAPTEPAPAGESGPIAVDASQLPAGFPQENITGRPLNPGNQEPVDALVERDSEQVSSGPIFRPFSELILTEQEPLTYPRRALDGAEGSVEVEFTVTETGAVSTLSIKGDAPAVFLQEAARAIRQWRFQPVLVNGQAVSVQTGLRVTFRG